MTPAERQWWRRFERVLRDMPEGLVIQVTVTGSVTLHRRVEGTDDNEREAIAFAKGEHRIYPSASGSRVWS